MPPRCLSLSAVFCPLSLPFCSFVAFVLLQSFPSKFASFRDFWVWVGAGAHSCVRLGVSVWQATGLSLCSGLLIWHQSLMSLIAGTVPSLNVRRCVLRPCLDFGVPLSGVIASTLCRWWCGNDLRVAVCFVRGGTGLWVVKVNFVSFSLRSSHRFI